MKAQTTTSDQNVFVGIDFGTTKTMVASYDAVKKSAKPLTFGRGKFEKPTSMYATETGELLFGEDADDEGITDLPNHIRRFKMKLGKPGLAHVGRKSGTALQLSAEFLGNLRSQLENQVFHTSVERVILTVPAMFGPAQRHDLTAAAHQAGFSHVELLEEPVAAGIAYCDQQSDLSKQLRFIVVDWGGGTFDVAHLDRSSSGEIKVHEDFLVGLDDIGGEVFDDVLWGIASSALESGGHGTLDSQSRENWGSYRRDLSRAKESLSSQSSVSMTFTLADGKTAKVSLNRTDFNDIISPMIQKAASFVSQLIVRAHNAGCPPEFILLAGGTSRIPLIGEELERITGVKCRQWSDGREAIALGAVIRANQLWGQQSTVNAQEGLKAGNETFLAMATYKSLVEGAWIDGVVTHEERHFLGKKGKDLGLTIEESQAIEIQLLGAPIGDVIQKQETVTNEVKSAQTSVLSAINQNVENKAFFKIRLEKSSVGLQIVALAPEAHADMQGDEFIRRTHFPMTYLINIENISSAEIHSVRVSLKSSDSQQHSILIPSVKPAKSGALSLSSADFEGWMVTEGDTLTVDATGLEAAVFEVTATECAAIDQKKALNDEIPCIVFVRKASFSSNFVLKVTNIQKRKIKITGFQSPAGSIQSPIEIEPDGQAEIGFCELSGNRNLAAGEEFLISIQGFRDVQGVIAEGQLKGSGAVWTVLGALGGLALAAAGG